MKHPIAVTRRTKILVSVPSYQWRTPSQAQPKDQFGRENCTRFRIRARLNDGYVVWRGWFDDRDDLDAFLWALATGSLHYERELWRLPTPAWHPDIGENLSYDFATVSFLTTPVTSNQTWTSPSDWDNNNNTIECLGGGGSGGVDSRGSGSFPSCGTGGGAVPYIAISNFSVATPGTTTATWQVGAGGTAKSGTSALNGVAGGATWFNNTANPGNGADNSQCSSAGGGAGNGSGGSASGGTAGATTASWGQTKTAGGSGGAVTSLLSGGAGTGGGGAGGPNGAGVSAASRSGSGVTAGGNGDAGSGGAGGNGASGVNAIDGGNGAEWTDGTNTAGSGGGGGGLVNANGTIHAGSGGSYGAGGGGAASNSGGTAISGAGGQGIIVITYTPLIFAISGIPEWPVSFSKRLISSY